MGKEAENSIFTNIKAAFLILIMHVLLIGGIGTLVLFFYGIVNHTFWMILGFVSLTAGGVYYFVKRLNSDAKDIKNVIGDSVTKGNTVEISFLGGVANFKISNPNVKQISADSSSQKTGQLAAPVSENGKKK
jgi:hypothetical protein